MLALMGVLVGVPILYIYIRRKYAQPKLRDDASTRSEPVITKRKQATPEQQVKVAVNVLFIIGGLSLLFGVLGLLMADASAGVPNSRALLITNLRSIGVGIIVLILAFFARRRSLSALVLAFVVFALNSLLGLIQTARSGTSDTFLICNVGLLLLTGMYIWNGIQGLRKIQAATAKDSNDL
jgi:hypothetical protein